MKGTFTMRN